MGIKGFAHLSNLLQCPKCEFSPFTISSDTFFTCERCQSRYFISEGVIDFPPDDLSLHEHEDVQQKTYDTYSYMREKNAYYWMYKEKRERQVIKALDLLSDLQPENPQYVVQWGGGEGLQSESYARLGAFCVSLDISRGMLKLGVRYAEELGYVKNMGFIAASAERRVPLRSQVFDVNMAFSTLNHIHPRSWGSYLAERVRVTKGGGLLFDVVPNLDNAKLYDSRKFRALKAPGKEQEFLDHVTRDRVLALYQMNGLQRVRWVNYDRVPDELWLVSLPEILFKKMLGIQSTRYPNWLYSNVLFGLLARLDDLDFPVPGVLWSRPKWALIGGTIAT